jgi:GNAT superfamily N-acetyltransferase
MVVKIESISKSEASKWVSTLPPSLAVGVLLSGDRWLCVDHVLVAKVDNNIAGIVTIAEHGETGNGTPAIVALYVRKDYRNHGIGFNLLNSAVDYMIKYKMTPIRMDILNPKVIKLIEKLPEEKRACLDIKDFSLPAGELLELE